MTSKGLFSMLFHIAANFTEVRGNRDDEELPDQNTFEMRLIQGQPCSGTLSGGIQQKPILKGVSCNKEGTG